MAKKRYFDYNDKTLFEGYKLLSKWHDTRCPVGGNGLHCGFPEKFIEKTMNKIKRLKAENKRLKTDNTRLKETLETKNMYHKY